MKRFAICVVLSGAAVPLVALGQAPQSADMWRVVTTTLASPAALQTGPTGVFWNPALALPPGSIHPGIQVVQTSDVLGLSGLLAGVQHGVGQAAFIGITLGRVEVRDLVRTAGSPLTELGAIPVYEQFAGIHFGVALGKVSIGGVLRGHESRFDATRSTGATVDAGLRLYPWSRLTLAAATHFVPLTLRNDNTTDYYGAVEYRAADVALWGHAATIISRYGGSYRDPGGLEHTLGGGLVIDDVISLDLSGTREVAFGDSQWRPAFQIGLALGRYSVAAARGNGLNGLGAMYRFALDVAL